MKTDRRTATCLNCNKQLSAEYKYCPHCGQKNSDNNVSVGTLLGDVFSNYFSLDSKFVKSFVPFFFRPGVLTNRFVEGKRVRFIQPVRLYVFTSLMFFFIMTSVLTRNNISFSDAFVGTNQVNDSTHTKVSPNLILGQNALDSIAAELNEKDSVTKKESNDIFEFGSWSGKNFVDFMKDKSVSDEVVLDSLGLKKEGMFTQRLAIQGRKILRRDLASFIPFLLGNIPIMMVFVVPVLALVLKLLYIRRKKLYITHLVHAIHLHAFAYLTYGLVFLMIYFSTNALDDSDNFALIAMGVVGVYSLVSFFTVYKQGVLRTVVKFLVVGFVYSFFMLLFLLGESFLSILYF